MKHPEMGKWELWKFFHHVSSIRPRLPDTQVLTKASIKLFLSKYPSVHVKPNYGQCGRGVIRAWRDNDNGFAFVREHGKVVKCQTIDELFKQIKSGRVQVVQRSIDLATINDRPFDVRVLMMRNVRRKWQYVGMLAKVAGTGWIITNKRSNGTVLSVDEALQQSLQWNDDKTETVKDEMIELGYAVCNRFDDYNRYRQIGIDMGIDARGRVWIIEENTGPGWSLFTKLKDKSMYNTIRIILTERGKLVTTRS